MTIILINHTRKQKDTNPFNMISGSTGLRGVADGAIVLLWDSEKELTALLFAEGRDIPKRRMQLMFNEHTQRWDVLADDLTEPEKFDDEEDDDWACYVDYEPKRKYLEINNLGNSNIESNSFLQVVVEIISDLMQKTEISESTLFHNRIITIGFDDGELIRIK